MRGRQHAAGIPVWLVVWTAACGAPVDERGGEGRSARASAQLAALLDSAWVRDLETNPFVRLREGVDVERLPALDYEAAEERAAFSQRQLERALAIDAAALSADERVTLETLVWQAEMAVEGHRYFWLRSVLTPYSSVLRSYSQIFPLLPLEDDEDLDRFVALVEQVPSHVRDLEDYVRGQFERDFIVSSQNLTPVVQLVRATAGEAEDGPFALPVGRASGLDPARVAEARARIGDIVRDSINPVLEELAAFLEGPYAARAPAGVGLSQYPEGREYYLYLTRLHTTMEVTPEEVQAAGHELLAEFRARMAEIRDRLGWEGSAEEFHEHLKTDPRYFPASHEEVRERLLAASTRMLERIDAYFPGVPEAPWDARRLAPELEPAMTYGYYSAPTAAEPTGIYYYNGSNLDQRSWLGLASISLHELIPGHHFQIAGQRESGTLPDYRRNTSYTAYTEGWGSYASYLGFEAGVYEDLYSEYGFYILESFLATRLVVDPGMNHFGWTREEARRFMRENTLESETQIATESLRYSTDLPGQALAYQMGKRKLLELRARAEDALGDGFDLRGFHDVVLRTGSVPMVVLEGQVDAWIGGRGSGDDGS
ncbi:MAG: DUF885 domain-containing protein [Gemmatimonadota bacterium]|uniref:DUF885 domain-containing protein n=1 Tax=Candidatus Palauibacter scopulicola TaxID=3056741 RepID=UPI00238C719D|nr:DUF885 domain-containing protein [Candidatus Palauibacter scopulicola]MDE2663439.1 DUF885 domain-containing protein [Candidatus Palauibacter scopulicola]